MIFLIVLAGVLFVFLMTLFLLLPKRIYFMALFSGACVGVFRLISMKMRKLDFENIVKAFILSRKSHQHLSLAAIESISTNGGHPMAVVEAINASKTAKIDMTLDFIKAVDVAGFDVLEIIKETISPKVVEVPLVSSVAMDKWEINVKISLTLKTNLKNFLSGVGSETIVARAIEAVVTKINNTDKASFLVSKPQLVDKAIFDASIDDDAKYELVSADVLHIDFGRNLALDLEKEQIEKNRIITTNQLEHRRLLAMAKEQEMKAQAEEIKLKAAQEELEVPKAIVEAINAGKMKDVVDYYKLQNLQADTELKRKYISETKNTGDFE